MEENKKTQQAVENTASQEKEVRKTRSPKGERKNNAPRKEVSPYTDSVVEVKRISKTVKGGRRLRFSALVISGDKKGTFGYGTGKSQEVPEAIKKASERSKANLLKVNLVNGDTIAHTVYGKCGATTVFLKPATEGTGVIAGGAVRTLLESAGVRNIYSKIYGSRNRINVIRATIDGLSQLKSKTNNK